MRVSSFFRVAAMILSKIVKSGNWGNGISSWNQDLSTWILEHAEESEEFRPFLALSTAGEMEPHRNQFDPAEEGLLTEGVKQSDWKPIRPQPPNQQDAEAFAPAYEADNAGSPDPDSGPDAPADADAGEPGEQAATPEPTYEDGLQEGMQQGLAQGRQEAMLLAEEKARELGARVDAVLEAVSESCQGMGEQAEEDLARLAMHLARQIVRGELGLSSRAIGQLVSASLENFSTEEVPTVWLHPQDKAGLEESGASSLGRVTLAVDDELSPGSVRVECGERHTEDLIEERLAELSEKLLGSVDAVFLNPVEPLAAGAAEDADPNLKGPE